MAMPSVWELGDQAYILGKPEITGLIDGILLTAGGMEYRFICWDDDMNRISHWVSAAELVKL
jgi:hypothetical protein